MKYQLRCVRCGRLAEKEPAYLCPACGGILDVEYPGAVGTPGPDSARDGVFRYAGWLPVEGDELPTLGEGDTPLVASSYLGAKLGIGELYFKLEGSNPSSSFKDRGIAVGVACAKRLGVRQMIIASSGNASASAAAYAARCGIPLVALVPERTPANKVGQAALHGAKILRARGKFSEVYALCRRMAENHGWFDLTTTFINPYAREGYKTIGYEIFRQLGRVPDWILCPTGAGPILASVGKAFDELGEGLPKLVCVQAVGCGPIADAFLKGKARVEACENPRDTLASGINDALNGYTQDGDFTLNWVHRSGGTAVLLSEEEIAGSVLALAREGIAAEPAAAVGAKALEHLQESGVIKPTDCVVVLVTGHGLKNLMQVEGAVIPDVVDSEEAVLAVLESGGCRHADALE